jgi:hypothetical protein
MLHARNQDSILRSPVTEAEFIRSIPSSATPGEREQFYQQWNRYKDTLALQPVNNFVMQNSAVDGLAAVQALKPADNAADFQFKASNMRSLNRTINASWMLVKQIPVVGWFRMMRRPKSIRGLYR